MAVLFVSNGFHTLGLPVAVSTEPVQVTVTATDSIAAESGPSSGLFTFHRSGPTTTALTVRYETSGTAVSPGDYPALTGSIVIPIGASSAFTLVTPADDIIAETEETIVVTVVAVLSGDPTALYTVGRPNSATVVVNDNDLGIVPLPTISIRATDPKASEPSAVGKFTIARLGATTEALKVDYEVQTGPITQPAVADSIASTGAPVTVTIPAATGGTDYQLLSGSATLPPGERSIVISVLPIDDTVVEGPEHVSIKLKPSALYAINQPDAATVIIEDNDPVNVRPSVEITSPKSGASFTAPASISIAAQATDKDGSVLSVEFFANDKSIGLTKGNPASASAVNPFQMTWNNVAVGDYSLTAKATDNLGGTTLSGPVKIRVAAPAPPTVVIQGKVVRVLESDPARPGILTVTRTGDLASKLDVRYSVTGNAQNGVDYTKLTGLITIPAGESSAPINVVPVPDKAIEAKETVTITLLTPDGSQGNAAPVPANSYKLGSPRSATVTIYDQLPNEAPKVTLTSPKSGQEFDAGTDIKLVAEATDSDGKISFVTFLVNEKPVGSVLEAPYTLVWNSAPAGRYIIHAKATDNQGETTQSSAVEIRVVPVNPGTRLIGHGAVWQYLDKGVEAPANWRTLSFDASTWASGPAQLGYGDGDEATVVGFGPNPEQKYITTYFRRTLTVDDPAAFTSLVLRLVRDDGAVVYVNNAEVYRNNMPDGAITAQTLASATVSGENESAALVVKLDPKVLVKGLNVVAVEVHQRTAGSSDLSFDLELNGLLVGGPDDPNKPATLTIDSPKEGTTFKAPADVVIQATAIDPKGYLSRVEFFANERSIGVSQVFFIRAPDPGTPVHHSLDWKNVPAGKYTLTAQAKDAAGALVTAKSVTILVESAANPIAAKQGLSAGSVLRFTGQPGQQYSIQTSADLRSWAEIGTVDAQEDTFEFTDPESTNATHQFYRAVPVTD